MTMDDFTIKEIYRLYKDDDKSAKTMKVYVRTNLEQIINKLDGMAFDYKMTYAKTRDPIYLGIANNIQTLLGE